MNQDHNPNIKKVLAIIIAGSFVLSLYLIVSSIITANNTGMLVITSSDPASALSITQKNSQAKKVGKGSAKIRLKPGEYTIHASAGVASATSTAQIQKKQTTSVYLKLNNDPKIQSVDNIDFVAMQALIDSGITAEQTINLQKIFYKFRPQAKTVVIQAATISPGSYDRRSSNPTFTTNFRVSVDSSMYSASLAYKGTSDDELRLYLRDSNNTVIYDSGPVGTL